MDEKMSSERFSIDLSKYRNETYGFTWLGFDRFHKLLYGLRIRNPNNHQEISTKLELTKLNLFTSHVINFKTIDMRNLFVQNSLAVASISDSGRYIAVLIGSHPMWNNSDNSVKCELTSPVALKFCLFEVETGNFNVYRFRKTLNGMFLGCILRLMCSNRNEWILQSYSMLDMRTCYYCITLNCDVSQCDLTLLTEYKSDDDSRRDSELFIDNKLIVINQPRNEFMTKMNIYNFETKEWIKLDVFKESNVPSVKDNVHRYKIFIQNCNLFGVSVDYRGSFINYDKENNVWCKMNIKSLLDDCKPDEVFSTNSFVVLMEHDTCTRFINLGSVLSLKDICFLKLFKTFNSVLISLTEDEILEDTIFAELPCSLKRRYFGPEYSWGQGELDFRKKGAGKMY